MRQERKVVTVLFCDLVGFTSRAEEMDPEDVAALLAPYHARLKDELERYGGTVEKFIGDAVMALFGAPIAHEDDPERAVRAGLAIRDFAEEEGIELRVGITTGEALISLDASPERGETMAAGDVVNTAARLQAAAPVNGVLVGEGTYRATRHSVDYDAHDSVEAKGKARSVPVWEARAPRARIAAERLHGTSLIGRSHELSLLVGALSRARQERLPQLVTIIGVPGIGKSRLVFELFQVVDQDAELISWRQGRCLPYGDGVTFWALGEIVKAQAGILESDSIAKVEEKLDATAGDPWVASHLRSLVGLSGAYELGGDRRAEAFTAWRQFLETLAAERPLVLVIEDLHWADETLLDFVDHLVDWASGVPLLVVGTARPELLERRPGWGGGKSNALSLSLSPLSDDDTARLIGELLERSVLPAETQQALLARAGGNPLYAEQFARMLDEGGALDDVLPETVQGLISARLDLLAREEKDVLQDAAVLGKVFWTGALASLSGVERGELETRLHSLERKQFVRRERRSAVAEDDEHAFRHVLVRDVAYGQIPRAERAAKHRLAAKWIEAHGRAEDQAELLAHHYLVALELTRAAGGDVDSLAERAREALRDAGDRALRLNALPAAARFYEDALELWPEDDREQPSLLFRLGRALRNTARGGPVLEAAFDRLLEAGDREPAAEAQAMIATIAWHEGDADRCSESLEHAAALLEEVAATPAKAFVLSQISRYRMLAGANQEAILVGREALTLAEELGLDEVRASVLNTVGTARVSGGDADGLADVEQSISISLAANSGECVRGYTNLAAVCLPLGRIEQALQAHADGMRAAERFGEEIGLGFLRGQWVGWLVLEGRWDEALSLADELIAASQAGSPHYLESFWLANRALIRHGRDDLAGAVADSRAALELARRATDPQAVETVLDTASFVLADAGQPEEALALVNELLEGKAKRGSLLLDQLGFVWVLVDADEAERVLAALEGAPSWPWQEAARAIARGEIVAGADALEAAGVLSDAAYARLRAAESLVAEGTRAEADEQLRSALAFYRSVGATRFVRQGEALLAAAS
jgi:class 3 adenylate cyclase/tetratricopeptide (TPR) repeat protein